MKSLQRIGLACAMMLALAVSFGCAKKNVSGEGTAGTGELTAGALSATDRAAQTITDGIIYFEFDKFDIQPQYNEMLRQKAELLKQYASIRIRIEGNCDERGTEEYNLALGGRRARSAYDYLLRLGVNPAQMETISYGKERPAALGSSPEIWARNRRDDFQILSR
jgi:peptidoglycan-associated lipoprotein